MEVGLVLRRRIHMDHESDVVDMDAARGDVRGHEDLDLTAPERLHVLLACLLRQVAL
jgi:hypothetical protein